MSAKLICFEQGVFSYVYCMFSTALRLSALFMGVCFLASCSSAPSADSNRSKIVLIAEDAKHDMTAKVSKVTREDGSGVTIAQSDYDKNFIAVESGRYSVIVECLKEQNGGIYKSGTSSGTFVLRSGELLRLEFMRDQLLVKNNDCPLLFSTNR